MKALFLSIMSLTLILSACAPAGVPTNDMPMNNGSSNMTLAPGASAGVNETPTPGSMLVDNPEAAHMMEPITAPSVQPATETIGGQPLDFRKENGVKVFELTTKAVQWPILDGTTVTAFTYNGTVPGPMIRVTEGDRSRSS